MKWLKRWLYDDIDHRGRIPWWVRKFWKGAHWCPEMDELLILWNYHDCFCGHAPQKKAKCVNCDDSEEVRFMAADGLCPMCAPPATFDF